MEYDNGGIIKCYYGDLSECTYFWNKFFENYKVIKTCNYGENNCSPIYKTKAEIIANGGKFLNNNCTDIGSEGAKAHIINDGSIIYTFKKGVRSYFYIDINGMNGPNKWGYDVFSMTLTDQQNKSFMRITDLNCPRYEKGGRRIKNVLLNDNNINNVSSQE